MLNKISLWSILCLSFNFLIKILNKFVYRFYTDVESLVERYSKAIVEAI